MTPIYTQTTAPSSEPVTLAALKSHLRVDTDLTDDDTYIGELGVAAREYVEQATGRQLKAATWSLYLDRWPENGIIEIERFPVGAVNFVKYLDYNYDLYTWGDENYTVDTLSIPARIVPSPYVFLPVVGYWPNAIQVEFTAGYSTVPERLKLAIKWIVAHWYANRESHTTDNLRDVPLGIQTIVNQFRSGMYR